MKTNFKFYFLLTIITAFLSAIVYGLGQPLVEAHLTLFSFGLLAITVICLSGMIKNVAALTVVEARDEVESSRVAKGRHA